MDSNDPNTIEFADGEAVGKSVWVRIVGMPGPASSDAVKLVGK